MLYFIIRKKTQAYLEKTSKEDTVKSTELIEDVEVKTADITERFKFFESYREPEKQKKQFRITPPRDPSQVKVVIQLCVWIFSLSTLFICYSGSIINPNI